MNVECGGVQIFFGEKIKMRLRDQSTVTQGGTKNEERRENKR